MRVHGRAGAQMGVLNSRCVVPSYVHWLVLDASAQPGQRHANRPPGVLMKHFLSRMGADQLKVTVPLRIILNVCLCVNYLIKWVFQALSSKSVTMKCL